MLKIFQYLVIGVLSAVFTGSANAASCRYIRTIDRIPEELQLLGESSLRCCTKSLEPTWWCNGENQYRVEFGECKVAGEQGSFWACRPTKRDIPNKVAIAPNQDNPPNSVFGVKPIVEELECSEKYFDQTLGPVRSQAGSGWCYAYGLADLLSFYLGETISASHISFEYTSVAYDRTKETRNLSVVLSDNGSPLRAFRYATKSGGFCREADMPSVPDPTRSFLPWVKDAYFDIRNASYDLLANFSDNDPSYQKILTRASLAFPKADSSRVLELIKSGIQGDSLLLALKDLSCSNRIEVKNRFNMEAVMDYHFSSKAGERWSAPVQLVKYIDKVTAEGKPSMISVKSELLDSSVGNGLHLMMLVGRKQIDGKCWYKIRNSWGETDQTYAPGIIQERGNIWIEKDQLGKMLEAVYWFEGKR